MAKRIISLRLLQRAMFCVLVALLAIGWLRDRAAWGGGVSAAPAPLPLIDFNSPDAGKQVTPTKGVPASIITVDKSGIAMGFPIQPAPHSGVHVAPATGKWWDLSAYGHVSATVTNTGTKILPFVMHVVDDAENWWEEKNTEAIDVPPGATRVLTVYLGYQYGHQPSAAFNPAHVKDLYIFLYDTSEPHSFRISQIVAGGAAGEKPQVDPATQSYWPANGVILGDGVSVNLAAQVEANGARVSAGPEGALAVGFAGGASQSLTIKPALGTWDFSQANEVRVGFKNVGAAPVTPSVAIGTLQASAAQPIAPGATTDVTVSFIPKVPAVGGKSFVRNTPLLPGTGTEFASEKVNGISILSDATTGAKSLLITSIVADAPPAEVPGWVGSKPPVAGDWVQTLHENFDGPTLDLHTWNIYGNNRIDGNRAWNHNHNPNLETHFSKENVLLIDGNAVLRFTKTTGRNDDSPNGKKTDYASGYLTTVGKWTQRYGYFEARIKLPRTLPGIAASFALLPDRGKAVAPRANRLSSGKMPTDTGMGGMEFDIMEFLSRRGVYRFNLGIQANVNGKDYKFIRVPNNYVQNDKDGYVTLGLLWLPGKAAIYGNGKELFHWENERVGDVPAALSFTVVAGGTDNLLMDDSQLPADLAIDYVKVWQRKDLVSPADGAKPNDGDPDEAKN